MRFSIPQPRPTYFGENQWLPFFRWGYLDSHGL